MNRTAALVVLALVGCGGDGDGVRTLARVGPKAALVGAADGRVFWTELEILHWADTATGAQLAVELEGIDWATDGARVVERDLVLFVHHHVLGEVRLPAVRGGAVRDRGIAAGPHPAGVVREGDCAYVLRTHVECGDGGAILGVPLVDGATCPRWSVPVHGLQPRPFAADGERFYWENTTCHVHPARDPPPGIYAVERTTGAVTALVPHEHVQGDLVRGARGLYWRGAEGVRHAPLTTPGTTPGATTVLPGAARCLLRSGDTLYVCRDDGIHRMVEGARTATLVPGTAGATSAAVDARALYWTTGTELRTRPR